ncbi:MAG: radical SAM protein [Proteobacteria bacterium]|nr:radical SAM protein [Pseudomonadota bacterium]
MSGSFHPAYLNLPNDELRARGETLKKQLADCNLCPRRCGVDRISGEIGFCKIAKDAVVSSFGPHYGEERPLVGKHGSGTVFFAGCNLGCIFCQNADISHRVEGRPATQDMLAEIFVKLQKMGCHNLNLVTPTHVTPQILCALSQAKKLGLKIPVVWNTGGYESPEILIALDGVVDIYMPDFKMWREETAERLLQASNYPAVASKAIKEMHRQVGDLEIVKSGVATRGLLIRHLVLPEGLADTSDIAKFTAKLSKNTYFNLMDQYRPCHMAHETPGIQRSPSYDEFKSARAAVLAAGLERLD